MSWPLQSRSLEIQGLVGEHGVVFAAAPGDGACAAGGTDAGTGADAGAVCDSSSGASRRTAATIARWREGTSYAAGSQFCRVDSSITSTRGFLCGFCRQIDVLLFKMIVQSLPLSFHTRSHCDLKAGELDLTEPRLRTDGLNGVKQNMEPQTTQVKLEVVEALVGKTKYSSPHAAPPHAHEDAVSWLVGLALQGPNLGTPAEPCCRRRRCCAAAPAAAPKRSRAVGASRKSDFRSAFIGVSWHTHGQQWEVQIRHNGEAHHLGHFDDEQEAGRAYDAAARRLRPNGEPSR